jgi:hypothetical protein
MGEELRILHAAVADEESFVRFLQALAADRADEVAKEKLIPSSPYGPGANGWENWTIEDFLDAAASWAEASMNGFAQTYDLSQNSWEPYSLPQNPWKRCADIMFAGKYYE